MCRYILYIAVALLAFGIGLFVVFKFYWELVDKSKTFARQEIEKSKSAEEKSDTGRADSDKVIFPTEEQFRKWQLDSFKPILEKWLKGKNITGESFNLTRNDDYSSNSQEEATTYLTDANGDGIKELALQTGCATVGNCEFWLFQKSGKSYRTILIAQMVQTFHFLRNRRNNYFDLKITSHGNAVSGGIAIYTFNGNEYKINECFGYEYTPVKKKNGESLYTKDGQLVMKDKPTLTPASCEGWQVQP